MVRRKDGRETFLDVSHIKAYCMAGPRERREVVSQGDNFWNESVLKLVIDGIQCPRRREDIDSEHKQFICSNRMKPSVA